MNMARREGVAAFLRMVRFLFLVAVTFLTAMFQGGFVGWFLFYCALTVLFFTFIVAMAPLRSIRLKRKLDREWIVYGEAVHVTITIKNPTRMPLFFLIVEDRLPPSLFEETDHHTVSPRGLFFPCWKKQFQFSYTVKNIQRGEYHLNGIRLQVRDLFGFFKKSITINTRQRILVYPKYDEIENWLSLRLHGEGLQKGRHPFHRDLTSVTGVRDYSPSDRIAWVDWKSTARMNKLLTKEFEHPFNKEIMLCLDSRTSSYKRQERPLFEQVVSVGASMGNAGIKKGVPVGLASLGTGKIHVPADTGDQQKWKILNHLAKMMPDEEAFDFQEIAMSFQRFSANPHVFFIGPVIDRTVIQLVDRVSRRGQKVSVNLVKGKDQTHLSKKEYDNIEQLKQRGIQIVVVNETDLGINEGIKVGVSYGKG